MAFADQGYTGAVPAAAAAARSIRLEVVKLPAAKRGFVLLPRRWVVERSFAWTARFRRLARDYERLAATLTGLHLRAFFVTYYVEVRGWSTADASILYTVFLGGFMFSSLIGGALGDWFDRKLGPRDRIMLMQLYLPAFAVMSFVALQIDWGHGLLLYVVPFLFGLVAAIGFSGAVLPMVAAVAPSELSATAFALLFSLVQGLLSALLSLALGYIAEAIGLKSVMFWLVTAPYAINVFYWAYPRDVGAQQAKLAASPAA
jgi:MFS family permease